MPSSRRIDPWIILLLAAGAVLLLANLGDANGRLWQDEAETAVLAKNTLLYGYPRAFDGVNRLNPALPLAPGEAWTYHPWLSMYVLAGSFALLGATTFAARLPFALMGLASVLLFHRMVQRMTGDRALARWAGLLLVTSVPFLLHMRQCRYYAPSVLLSLWSVLAYWRFFCAYTVPDTSRGGRYSSRDLELSAALALLFHANHGVFGPVAAALTGHFIFTRYTVPDTAKPWGRALLVGAVVLALTLPFALYLQAGQHHGELAWKEIRHHAEFYFRQVNKFVLPVAPWAIALALWRPHFRDLFGDRETALRSSFGIAAWLIGIGFLFLIFGPVQRHFRYLVFLIPWLLLVQAALLRALFLRSRAAGVAAFILFALTDLHYTGPAALAAQVPAIRAKLSSPNVKPRCILLEMAGELTHTYRGPMDGVIEILSQRAKPGQTIKIPYGDPTVLFYTDLVLEPIVRPEDFLRETYPDWVVLRRDWIPGEFFGSRYHQNLLETYRKHELDAPDIPWQNRPDPGYHRFRTDREAAPLVVLEKAQPR